jgi:hypothetical protein
MIAREGLRRVAEQLLSFAPGRNEQEGNVVLPGPSEARHLHWLTRRAELFAAAGIDIDAYRWEPDQAHGAAAMALMATFLRSNGDSDEE